MIKLSPYRQLMKQVAKKKGIKFTNFDPFGKFQMLQKGKKKVLLEASRPFSTPYLAVKIANSKFYTNFLLQKNNIKVPAQKKCYKYKEALSFLKKYKDIVAKPGDFSLGKGVTLHIKDENRLKKAFSFARKYSKFVVVEKFIVGSDYRITVVDYKYVYALERIPAFVEGDGKNTVSFLIDKKNKIKLKYKKDIKKDQESKDVLKKQGLKLDSVPDKGQRVFLREIANIAAGGTSVDATDIMHPEVKKMAIQIARVMKLPVAGIDLMTKDITKPGGVVIEVNSRPHIILHHYPHIGKPRAPAGKVIDMAFK